MKDLRSILLMSFKSLKKKKLQSTLIALTIAVAALVFSTSIGLLGNLRSPVENSFKELNATQDQISFNSSTYDIKDISNWWRTQPGIEAVKVYPSYKLSERAIFKGKRLDKDITLCEVQYTPENLDKLLIVDGKKSIYPKPGDAWIPTGFAYSNGIKVGDELSLPINGRTIKVKASAIVVDLQRSSTMIGSIRIWFTPGELKRISPHKPVNAYVVGIEYKDIKASDKIWGDFEKHLRGPFNGYRLKYDTIVWIYSGLYKIIGTVLLVFSIIILLIAVFIIYFTISNSILSDYKAIGILKSQGFSGGNIIALYSTQYLTMCIIAIPLGVIASSFALKEVMKTLIKAIGISSMNASMLVPALLTFVVLSIVVAAASCISSLKGGRIKPAEAIRFGAPPKRFSKHSRATIQNMKRLPLTAALGIKQLLAYKGQSLFLFMMIFITVFVLCSAINSNNSLKKLGSNLPYWGFDNSQVTIQRSTEASGLSHNSLMAALKAYDRVQAVIPWCWVSVAWKESDTSGSEIIEALAYDGDMNSIGMINTKGRNPEKANEISIGSNLSKETGKTAGDYIDLYVNKTKKTFLITGVFQTMLDGGIIVRVQKSAVKDAINSYEGQMYAIRLKPSADVKAFKEDMKKAFGSKVDIKNTYDVYKGIFSSITDNMSLALILITIIFISVCFITIFNFTLLGIYEMKKSYGIYKALGLTPNEIRMSIIYKILLLGISGIIVGIPISFLAFPSLLGVAISSTGLTEFPFITTLPGTISLIPLCLLLCAVSAWIPSRKVLKINPRMLIQD